MNGLMVLFRRELALAWGRGGGPMLALPFYACVATLLPMAISGEMSKLATIASGSTWLALALTSLLSLERLFERDYEDGALDLLTLGGPPLEAVCFIKCLAQWLATGAPLALMAPIVALGFGASGEWAWLMIASALLGGLGFAFTGGMGAALALGSRRGGVLIAVIVLPLFAPPVIFGAGALAAATEGLSWQTGFALLGGYSLASAALSPFAMAAACRNALS